MDLKQVFWEDGSASWLTLEWKSWVRFRKNSGTVEAQNPSYGRSQRRRWGSKWSRWGSVDQWLQDKDSYPHLSERSKLWPALKFKSKIQISFFKARSRIRIRIKLMRISNSATTKYISKAIVTNSVPVFHQKNVYEPQKNRASPF